MYHTIGMFHKLNLFFQRYEQLSRDHKAAAKDAKAKAIAAS